MTQDGGQDGRDEGGGRTGSSSHWSGARSHFPPMRQARPGAPASRKVDDRINQVIVTNGFINAQTAAAIAAVPFSDTMPIFPQVHGAMAAANIDYAETMREEGYESRLRYGCGRQTPG